LHKQPSQCLTGGITNETFLQSDHFFTKLHLPTKVEVEYICYVEKFRKFQDTGNKTTFALKTLGKTKKSRILL